MAKKNNIGLGLAALAVGAGEIGRAQSELQPKDIRQR